MVAAATSLTTRTSVKNIGVQGIPTTLLYSLSAGGVITGTAGDDWYIAINAGPLSIVCNQGTNTGSIPLISNTEVYISYLNNDTVAHRMSASFVFLLHEVMK